MRELTAGPSTLPDTAAAWGGADIWDGVRQSIRVMESVDRLSPSDVIRPLAPTLNEDLVSVIIPMRNAAKWIDLCLKGILAQTHSNLEVFCIDDCSSDDSYERVVRRFGADGRLGVVRLKRRVGPYQIKNWALAAMVRASYVAMQDADDFSHPTRIAEQLGWMRAHGVRVCGTYVHQFSADGTALIYGTQPPIPWRGQKHNLVRYAPIRAIRTPEDAGRVLGAGRFSLAKHGSQIFESALLREFGGFDGRTIMVGDTELNWRLLRFMDIGSVPSVLYARRIHADSLTRRPDTGYGSPARRAKRAEYDRRHEEISRSLDAGETSRTRALCTQDLFHGDVEVADLHRA